MKKTLFFSALVALMAGMIFAGCKKDDDKDDPSVDPTSTVDPSAAFDESDVVGKYFYGFIKIANSANFEIVFTADHKAVISSKNEVPVTLSWEMVADRKLKVTLDDKDVNEIYGTFDVFDLNYAGDELTVRGTDFNGNKFEAVLKRFSTSLKHRIESSLPGTVFIGKANGDDTPHGSITGNGDLRLNFITPPSKGELGTARITHAGEFPMNIKWEITDEFNQKISFQTVEGALEPNLFPDMTNVDWYGLPETAEFNEELTELSGVFTDTAWGTQRITLKR